MPYTTVTELPGEKIPGEQYDRMFERYQWAAGFVVGKDVLECACGAGQGAQLLSSLAKSYTAGDYDSELLDVSQANNPSIRFERFDAMEMPFDDATFDVVLVCEAIYYFKEIPKFLMEVNRVLKHNGKILIVSANPDLFDFNPGKLTFKYPGVLDMREHFEACHFKFISAEGGTDTGRVNFRQKVLRPLKFAAASLRLIPTTMTGKALFKRLFFGGTFKQMPASVYMRDDFAGVRRIDMNRNDTTHKVLYFVGEKCK